MRIRLGFVAIQEFATEGSERVDAGTNHWMTLRMLARRLNCGVSAIWADKGVCDCWTSSFGSQETWREELAKFAVHEFHQVIRLEARAVSPRDSKNACFAKDPL